MLLLLYFLAFRLCQSQCNTPVPATAAARDRRDNKGELKIVNYNAEWLYWTGCRDIEAMKKVVPKSDFPIWGVTNKEDTTQDDPWDDIVTYMGTHIANTAKYLDDMNADIYVIEEACDCATLERVRLRLPYPKNQKYRTYLINNGKAVDATGEDHSMQIGIITKIDPVRVNSGVNDAAKIELVHELTNKRVFQAEFDIGDQGKKLFLFGAHLIAGDRPSSLNARRTDATKVMNAAHALATGANNYVVITGDMNAKHDSFAYKTKKSTLCGGGGAPKILIDTFLSKDPDTGVDIMLGKFKVVNDDGIKVTDNSGDVGIAVDAKLFKIEVGGTTINCAKKTIRFLHDELTRIKNVAYPTTPIKSSWSVKIADETVAKLTEHNFAECGTKHGAQNTHYQCLEQRANGILDYFFLSQRVRTDLAPEVTYIHEHYTKKDLRGNNVDAGERLCNLWSDHSPIQLKLTTNAGGGGDFRYNAHSIMYGDHYNQIGQNEQEREVMESSSYNKQYNEYVEQLLLYDLGLISFILMMCIVCGASLLCGFVVGFRFIPNKT
eukprot:49955_1